MKPLTLHPHEIIRLLDTGSVTVWRPMKPQPKWDTFREYETWRWKCKGGHAHVWDEGREPDEVAFVNQCAPHPPGSDRWVKERFGWAVTPKGKSVIVYQADNQARPVLCDNEGEGDCVGIGKKPVEYVAVDGVLWKSAQHMPRWASRLSVVAKAVQARQVESVTEEEAVEAGLADLIAFSEWWRWRFDTLGPDPWAWATKMERKG